jgi:hypothetical protein
MKEMKSVFLEVAQSFFFWLVGKIIACCFYGSMFLFLSLVYVIFYPLSEVKFLPRKS